MSTAPQDTPVSPPPPPARPAEVARRGAARTWVIAGVALIAVAFGVQTFLSGRNRVSTDDAQIEGHIVPVIAKVGGYVAEVRVEENQTVHAGDLLVRLDDRDLRTRLAQAEAQLTSAQAVSGSGGASGEARARIAAARANVTQAQAAVRKTRADLERYRTLAASNII